MRCRWQRYLKYIPLIIYSKFVIPINIDQWLSHVLRMKDDRIAKTILVCRMQETRRVWKPRTSWLTSVVARTGMRLGDVIRNAEKRCDWNLLNFQAGAYVRPPIRNMTQPQRR